MRVLWWGRGGPATGLLTTACITAGLFVTAACGSGEPVPSTPEPPVPQRIVLVDPDFDVWSVQSDGGNPQRLTGSASEEPRESGADISYRPQQALTVRHTWPTWSPDGRFVALSRTPGSGNALASLVLLDTEDGTERLLHETHPLSIGLVARGAPHYALWSPTSEFLSFVAPRGPGQGLGLFAVRPGDGEPFEVAANAPLYHVWSPDGRYILVHRREQLLLHDTQDRSTIDLDADSLRYRVPAFSPDGDRIAYVVEEGGAGRLVTSNLDGTDRIALMDVPGEAAFAWSPAGGRIAVARKPLGRLFYGELHVVDDDGSGVAGLIAPNHMTAFYWSPDGERIARAAFADALRWEIVDPATGAIAPLTGFTPTPDFLTHLQFFDQFAPSHLVWSADSTELLFTGALEDDVPPQIWLLDATGNDAPRSVAEARLAFWVPPATE